MHRAHAHLRRAHELLHASHRELYTVGFGGSDDVIIKTTLATIKTYPKLSITAQTCA